MESKDRDFNRADSAYATGGSIHPDENFSFDNDYEPIYDINNRLKAYNSFPANSLLPASSLYALGFKLKLKLSQGIKAFSLDSLNKNQDDLIVEKLPNLVETCLQEHNSDSSHNPSKEVSWYLDKLRYLLNKGIDISEENLVEAIEVFLSERRITEFNPEYIASKALDLKSKQNQKIESSNLIVSVINPNLSIEVIRKFMSIKYYKYPNDIK